MTRDRDHDSRPARSRVSSEPQPIRAIVRRARPLTAPGDNPGRAAASTKRKSRETSSNVSTLSHPFVVTTAGASGGRPSNRRGRGANTWRCLRRPSDLVRHPRFRRGRREGKPREYPKGAKAASAKGEVQSSFAASLLTAANCAFPAGIQNRPSSAARRRLDHRPHGVVDKANVVFCLWRPPGH